MYQIVDVSSHLSHQFSLSPECKLKEKRSVSLFSVSVVRRFPNSSPIMVEFSWDHSLALREGGECFDAQE